MVFIYILQLEQGKYYICKRNSISKFENNFRINGCEWTNIYKPIRILQIIPNCNNYDVDIYTKLYMYIYGIDNVRGGIYSSVNLDSITKINLMQANNSNKRCFKCGLQGHFAKDCYIQSGYYHNYDKFKYLSVWCCEYCDKEFETKEKCINHEYLCQK